MSLLLKAFPHGRPRSRAPRALLVLTLVTSLALLGLPLSGVAQAQQKRHPAHSKHVKHHKHAGARKARKHARPPRVPGQPPANYVIAPGSYFSFPNKGARGRQAIRGRVLSTIRSVWGGRRDAYGAPLTTNGTIRIATWTFDDWKVARALVAAKKRGVSVQVLVAKNANRGHASWRWLRSQLGTRYARKHFPATARTWSWAHACRGSCRGRGGTAHSKYFLFSNVGAAHLPTVTVQTSMNLTTFAFTNQWNQAQVAHSPGVFRDFSAIFGQSRFNRALPDPYHSARYGNVHDFFFPRYQRTALSDPAYQILRLTGCAGAAAGGTGHTRIDIIQYAIYGNRGEWLSRGLRYLWEHGCDVSILYSVASRPVLTILRSHTGRGPIPMRQSVTTNGYGTIVSYNHSKWMTIVGRWNNNPSSYLTFNGSANWADLALGDDEQMQLVESRAEVARYLRNFAATWKQRSSHQPGYGVLPKIEGRVIPYFARDVPETAPTWGRGVFKYMTPD